MGHFKKPAHHQNDHVQPGCKKVMFDVSCILSPAISYPHGSFFFYCLDSCATRITTLVYDILTIHFEDKKQNKIFKFLQHWHHDFPQTAAENAVEITSSFCLIRSGKHRI